ncbi:MAG: hypothetical protein WCJ11_12645 [Methylococcaceae bacterium]
MSTLTIDTNQAIKRLKVAGFTDKQADEIVETLTLAQKDLVNREYLDYKLEKELNPIKLDLMALKTTVAAILAGVIALIVKAYG